MNKLNYQRTFLPNGLELIVHEDHGSQMAVVNLLYKVGSRNELSGKTGLAHFFEHLMFGGSKNVPLFDREVDRVGGTCNAFTSPDITNYYISLPATNLETALWLESDRMFQLQLTEKTIETQRKVVIEEFKQRYLNQPYGDVFHHLRNLAFKNHPYRWPTIGEKIQDIEEYKRNDVEEFYRAHYSPDNAILVIAGNVEPVQVKVMVEKWFGDIPSYRGKRAEISIEKNQTKKRSASVVKNVPTEALYKSFKMPGRMEPGYLEADLITDYLGFGNSSKVQTQLVKNGDKFASAGAYVLGSYDPALLIFSGKMEEGVSAKEGEVEIDKLISEFLTEGITHLDLQKIKNQNEAMKTYEGIQLLNRAMSLAYHAFLGDPAGYFEEFDKKSQVPGSQIMDWAHKLLKEEQSSVLYYESEKNAKV